MTDHFDVMNLIDTSHNQFHSGLKVRTQDYINWGGDIKQCVEACDALPPRVWRTLTFASAGFRLHTEAFVGPRGPILFKEGYSTQSMGPCGPTSAWEGYTRFTSSIFRFRNVYTLPKHSWVCAAPYSECCTLLWKVWGHADPRMLPCVVKVWPSLN